MLTSSPHRRVARLPLLLAVTLALLGLGCGGGISKDDFRGTLVRDAGLSEEVAECVTDELFRRMSDGQIDNIYRGERAQLSPQERQAVDDAAVLCASGGPRTSTGGVPAGGR